MDVDLHCGHPVAVEKSDRYAHARPWRAGQEPGADFHRSGDRGPRRDEGRDHQDGHEGTEHRRVTFRQPSSGQESNEPSIAHLETRGASARA